MAFDFFKKRKKEPKSMKEVTAVLKELEKKVNELSKKLKNLREKDKLSLQKIAMVRFNPFSEIGGNQSFCVALLDENDDGLVITSLYSREGNRVYGKPVKKGKSSYPLSEEEKSAIKKAIGANR
jgi:hypothetical protein